MKRSNYKALIGYLPSIIVNRFLSKQLTRSKLKSVLDFTNRHPNWFEKVDRKFLIRTNFGFDIWCDRWDVIGQTIIETGQWEGLLSRTIQAILRPGDTAVDIGANIGYDSMIMSLTVGATGTVIAFEPDHGNLAALLKNLKNLPHQNVIPISLALSQKTEKTRISIADDSNRGQSNLRPRESGPSQPILSVRFDKILNIENTNKIRLAKMDIEGYELNAIKGMGDIINKFDYITCEITPKFLNQCGSSAKELFDYMYSKGFESYCAQPVSDSHWIKSDENFSIRAQNSSHFDALFCKEISPELEILIK